MMLRPPPFPVRWFLPLAMPVLGALLLLLSPLNGYAQPNADQAIDSLQRECTALGLAIDDLVDTFGSRYSGGRNYAARCESFQGELMRITDPPSAEALERLQVVLAQLRRDALLANPLVREQPILFVTRHQYAKDHHNSATMFQTGEINESSFRGGGTLKTIDLAHNEQVTTLIDLPEGIVRDPEVHFDAKTILVSLRQNPDDDYHLFELSLDDLEKRQLTAGAGVSDIDPVYLPDGRILFSSTREPKYCQCNRHIMCNLFTIDAEGRNLDQIGHSTLHEGHASLLSDGRVLYDRWEYVDRNFGDAQGLWVVNPDGTNHAVVYGNNTASPGGVLEGRGVPGTDYLLTTFSSCHDRPWGALALIDPSRSMDGKQAVLQTWPASAIDLVDVGNYDTFKKVHPKYEDPYPLSAHHFLCSRMVGDTEEMGIYLLDVFGNEVLIHQEGPGCFDPMPLAPRAMPAALPSRIDVTQQNGTFYVGDVYVGSGMEQIQRGTVKWLRVIEVPEKRYWTHESWNGSGTQAPAMAFDDFNNKRILGTVPVESDGSAYFSIPADRFVYFQLLDADGMMVQSMRSGTMVRPGETTGCVGCHDNRHQTLAPGSERIAMQRLPSELIPWYGPPRNFSYTQEVQPVFDKNCISCHDYDQIAGDPLNLAGDRGLVFNTSYLELRNKNMVRTVGAGPATIQSPKSWGAHASRLAEVLRQGHGTPEIDSTYQLDPEAIDRVITWIDINAPYYPQYASAYPKNRYGRSPLTRDELSRLSELTQMDLSKQENASQISFTRPQKSPCLAVLRQRDAAGYHEAIELIQEAARRLTERPRADMPGFRLGGIDAERERKYQASRLRDSTSHVSSALGTQGP
ncbi:HzsA-related protein [Novipirellula artificiosorum]|uniref:Cytochrome c domain-containing protein n=1 Tax=Novipirellula artificiosorum TaxID=2528016 RepID=A0A5C6DH80_9BACT|nr:hypothetical protein [Novipirellula artificiosorum]TWU34309.1 hypothetical protein Poly41_44560 [Novipirellula artificiosorum]